MMLMQAMWASIISIISIIGGPSIWAHSVVPRGRLYITTCEVPNLFDSLL